MTPNHLLSAEIDEFISYCQTRGLQEVTTSGHRDRLLLFLNSIDKNHSKFVEEIDKATITHFIQLQRRSASPSRVDAFKRSLRTFFNWIDKQPGVEIDNLGRGIFLAMSERRPKEGVSQLEINKLISSCDKNYYGTRDHAIILLLSDTGIRTTELCDLLISDLNVNCSAISIRSDKPHHSRRLPLTKPTTAQLYRYLKLQKLYSPSDHLFTNSSGKRIIPREISTLFRKRSLSQNISDCVTPSDLRITFGQRVYFETHDMYQVARQMGYTRMPDKRFFENIPLDEMKKKMEERD